MTRFPQNFSRTIGPCSSADDPGLPGADGVGVERGVRREGPDTRAWQVRRDDPGLRMAEDQREVGLSRDEFIEDRPGLLRLSFLGRRSRDAYVDHPGVPVDRRHVLRFGIAFAIDVVPYNEQDASLDGAGPDRGGSTRSPSGRDRPG